MRIKYWKAFVLAVSVASLLGANSLVAADYVSVVTNTPNLLGYWRFDPVFQTNSLVNGYMGTLEGNAMIGAPYSGYPLPSDPSNQALLLDGTNSYLTTTLTGQITNQGSVIAWVYLTEEPSTAGHFFQITGQSESGNDFDFQIETDNTIHFFTDSGSSTVYANGIPSNQWHFLAATFIANSNRPIYLDGAQVATSIAGNHSVNPNAFSIGENLVFTGRFFAGKMSEVAVFNRALTAAEIAAIYQAGAPVYLNITQQPGAVVLTWPTNYPSVVLQSNSAIENPDGWNAINPPYGMDGTNFAVTNAVGAFRTFYRLEE